MPERKRFFSIDVFPYNDNCVLDWWLAMSISVIQIKCAAKYNISVFLCKIICYNIKICYDTGCLKKLSFAELGISRFVTNILSISSQLEARSPKAQFGKTQLFWGHPVPVIYKQTTSQYTR